MFTADVKERKTETKKNIIEKYHTEKLIRTITILMSRISKYWKYFKLK